MKSYAISPAFELVPDDERSLACIELISRMVVDALRRGGDHFHFVVDWLDPKFADDSGIFRDDHARPHIQPLGEADALLDRIRKCVSPFNGTGSTVRSATTCRAATFGYDGQAFLCLRHEDAPPETPDQSLAVIEERSDYLTQTDYFDGWLREVPVR